MVDASQELQSGDLLDGQYRILEHIASGGVGSIYRAQWNEDIVAVKVLHPEFSRDEEAVSRLQREAEAVNRLNHPEIIETYGFGTDPEGRSYLVLEWLDGCDLDVLLQEEGAFEPNYAAWIALLTARGLHAAHQQDIIHRDLKPENIYLLPGDTPADDRIKILDFGIAKIQNAPELRQITRMGTICGTPEYMSPEQGRGTKLDGRSDLYSLGCVLFTMLMGHPPFENKNPLEILMKHQSSSLPSMPDHIPKPLRAIVIKATAKKVDDRQANLAEFANQLEAFLSGLPLPDDLVIPEPQHDSVPKVPAIRYVSQTSNRALSPEEIAAARAQVKAEANAHAASQRGERTADLPIVEDATLKDTQPRLGPTPQHAPAGASQQRTLMMILAGVIVLAIAAITVLVATR